jgi:hypothetical protein
MMKEPRRRSDDDAMKLRDRLMRWWKPAQWEEDHPLSDAERVDRSLQDPDRLMNSQHGVGAESWDRVDVERDLRKP